jgi:beta-glucanase (GH16 family)
MRLYENADEVSSVAVGGSIRDANGPLRIGGRVPGGGWFKGVLDEVRVHNRALSAAEIRRGMRRGAPAKPAPAAAPPPAPAPSASGVPAPAGDLPGWRQILLDDFAQDVASWGDCTSWANGASCPGLAGTPYASKWWAYPSNYQDTREKNNGDGGFYQPSDMYMSGGQLHLPLSRANGTSRSQAPVPKATIGRTYGRFSLRARSDSSPNFKVAWLMWRVVTNWGEIDFPEADLDDDGICAVNHAMNGGDAFKKCANSTDFSDGNWHTYTTEWTPGRLRFYVDGILFGETTNQVPSTAMTWIIQSETRLSGTLESNAAPIEIDIDWVAVWAPA